MKMSDEKDEERPRFLFICTNLLVIFYVGFFWFVWCFFLNRHLENIH